ncbi:hypothetical protein BGX33_005582 [Mortierella sp. NVP41]|nr:hypothetical protein BGX33_005582 [Mortierella sp. NVP41]
MLMTKKNWRSSSSHSHSLAFEMERGGWTWPEMDPWKTIALSEKEESEDLSPSTPQQQRQRQKQQQQHKESSGTSSNGRAGSSSATGIKTWDLNDPALSLGKFLDSLEWKTQSLVPGADFVNLLRVLRPVDHAFFITLFVNQSPGRMEAAREDDKGMSPKATTSTLPIRGQHRRGSWIQDYIEYQDGILDGTLSARYTIHACSSVSTQLVNQQPHQERQQDQQQQHQQEQPCGDLFSRTIAMTLAFAWSIKESRGFFLQSDQIQYLQGSFDSPLFQHWSALPPKAESAAKINIEEMTTKELESLFQLQDSLFPTAEGIEEVDDEEEDEVRLLQSRLWELRSRSRNRASFERALSSPNDPIIHPHHYQTATTTTSSRIGKKTMSPSRMQKLKGDLELDGVELVLQQDLLPLFVNTTHSLDYFVDLGLPLPDRILEEHQARQSSNNNQHTSIPNPPSIRAPSAHGSLFGSSSSSSSPLLSSSAASHQKATISAALHAAIHDDHDPSRIQAAPKTFGCLLDILLQPHLDLQHPIHPYTTLFKLPAIFSIGIYIRSPPPPSPIDQLQPRPRSSSTSSSHSSFKSMSMDRQKIVDRYLTCARQIAREFAPKRKGQKVVYVVVSEDAGMAKVMESQEEWDEEEQQLVLENWVLSKTDYQVVSDHSDFAKVAVWRTRREGRSVVIRENPVLERFMMDNKEEEGYVDMLNCGTPLNNLIFRD